MSSYFIDFSFTEQYNILQRGGFVLNKEYYETVDKIKFELEKIRPKLIKDGGNIEFINFKNVSNEFLTQKILYFLIKTYYFFITEDFENGKY